MPERTLPELLDDLQKLLLLPDANFMGEQAAEKDAIRAEILRRYSPPAPATPDRIVRAWRFRNEPFVCYRMRHVQIETLEFGNGIKFARCNASANSLEGNPDFIELSPAEVAALNEQEKR